MFQRLWAAVAVGLAICGSVHAQIDWLNAAGGNFLTNTNWAGGVTPTATDNVRILIATSSPITLGSNKAINQFLFDNAGATMNQNGGTFSVGGLMTFNSGAYNLTGSFTNLNLAAGMNMTGGTFTQGSFATLNLTGTMTLSGGAVYNFNSGIFNGGTVTGGGNRLKLNSGVFNNVAIGVNTIDTSTGTLRIQGGTTFEAASAYTFGTGFSMFVGQSGFSNLAITMGDSTSIYGNVANSTWTIGSSGTASPAVTYGGGLLATISTSGVTSNNSVIVDSTIQNTGTGVISIGVSGSMTNSVNGILQTSNGRIEVANDLDATNHGSFLANGGEIRVTPSGNFLNSSTGTLTANGGMVNLAPTGSITNNGAINATNGTVILNAGSTISNTGTITIASSGTVSVLSNIAPADLGTVSRATPNTGVLSLQSTMTLPANTDIAGLGTLTLQGGGIITSGSGGPYTLSSSNAAKIKLVPFDSGGTINNVNLAAGILNLTTGNEILRITGNTTFANGSSYTMGTSTLIYVQQTNISNVSFDLGNGGGIYGNTANSTWTIGLSGTGVPAIRNTGSLTAGLSSGQSNNSLINNDVIENAGSGLLGINPTGNFTNNGIIRTTATSGNISISPGGNVINVGTLLSTGGTIFVTPGGTFTIGVGSQILVQGNGRVETPLGNVTNNSTINVTNGQFNVSPGATGAFTNSSGATTTVLSTSSVQVGNSTGSMATNSGIWTVGTSGTPGGSITVGTSTSVGQLVNASGTLTLNGTANARTTVNGGTLSGNATINGTVAAGLVLSSGGKLAPGNSPGQITIGGGLDVGGTLELDISSGGGNNSNSQGNTTPGTGFDTITVKPPPNSSTPTNVTIRTASTNFRLLTANADQNAFNNDSFWSTTQRWAIIRTTAANNGSVSFRDANNNLQTPPISASVSLFNLDGTVSLDPTISHPTGFFAYSQGPALDLTNYKLQVDLVWSPVPEPMGLFVIAGMTIAFGVRRRWRISC